VEGEKSARTKHFEPFSDQVFAVRNFVGLAANEASVDNFYAELSAGELATNAVLHAKTAFDVTVHVRPGHLRVEISDGSLLFPTMAESNETDRDYGRGLLLMEAVSDAWGAERTTTGKRVWFIIGA
jgi:anti-sigma regulatory factor (Ser/Thr protein kinase)